MPSLRRTTSSPSVRSSPYPASLGSPTGRGHGPRRSSGSEISSRRVLADIDWWRVTQGQHDPSADANETETEERGDDRVDDRVRIVGDALGVMTGAFDLYNEVEVQRPATPALTDIAFGRVRLEESVQAQPPFKQFEALAISPRTPIRRQRQASDSSVESSPEAPLTPRESLYFDDMGFADEGTDIHPIQLRPFSLAALNSYSFAEFTTPEETKGAGFFGSFLGDAFIADDSDFFA